MVVQEVDKERGRIGLKLVAKHENGGLVMPEELIERAKDAPPREEREERRAATAAERGGRDRGRSARAVRRARIGDGVWLRPGPARSDASTIRARASTS